MWGYVVLCLLLQLQCQPGENNWVCSSYSSSHFLPASQLASCPPWVQWTVCTVRYSKTVGTVSKISKREAMKPTPVFLPGEFPWTEKLGGLQSMGSQRIRYYWNNLACTHYPIMISSFITSTKNPFPNKVTFSGSRLKWIWGGHSWTQHKKYILNIPIFFQ